MRLSAEALALRDALSAKLGISGTAVLELALREFAERRGITAKPRPRPKPKAPAQV